MRVPRSNFLMKPLFALFFATNQGKIDFGLRYANFKFFQPHVLNGGTF